ncbi:hypothetical protein Ade02nite_33810 [Paractinoplanes deccanensis]|uniref:DUF4062 domain-containing protein n=1 Tax=Paractinoplanes deccanensis TaxID=113561 RepID=A0ABQ3Y423_9ACTN|nr:hypothetical protein [Actinoplanes deccanensis]GID74740.1 hypothetical protein Ade02nite_33810 [Actinoplanes deccanensis]
MVYPANVVSVLIASPSDVAAERDALRQTLWEFNDEHAAALQVILLPVLWETHSRADLGSHPQDLLDTQIVDSADMVIGIFWTKIGSLLPDGTAATVHELERVVSAGKPGVLCFSNQPVVPSSIDPKQYSAVQDFKSRAQTWGIYREYSSVEQLTDLIKRDLLRTVRERLHLPTPESPQKPAELVADVVAKTRKEQRQKVDSKGRLKIQNYEYLVFENIGSAVAENVDFDWVAPDPRPEDWQPVSMPEKYSIEYLVPGAPIEMPVWASFGSTSQHLIRITWTQKGGADGEKMQTVRF